MKKSLAITISLIISISTISGCAGPSTPPSLDQPPSGTHEDDGSVNITVEDSAKSPEKCSGGDYELLEISQEIDCISWMDSFDYRDGVGDYAVYQLNITNLNSETSLFFIEPIVGYWNTNSSGEEYWYNCGRASRSAGEQGYNAYAEQEIAYLNKNESKEINVVVTSAKYNWGPRSFDCYVEVNVYQCDPSSLECEEDPLQTIILTIQPVNHGMGLVFCFVFVLFILMSLGLFPSDGILRGSGGAIAGFAGKSLKVIGFIFGGFLLYKLTKDDDW